MKTAIITILIGIALVFLSAGCESDLTGVNSEFDGITSAKNSFTVVQEYGFCDTACIAENVIIGDYILPYVQESYVEQVYTGDTTYNNLFKTNFIFFYNTQNSAIVDFGNGVTKTYNGQGIDSIKYFCNQNYEVIITYE
jgi:hypothetical protein